jgi:hypothetical protein
MAGGRLAWTLSTAAGRRAATTATHPTPPAPTAALFSLTVCRVPPRVGGVASYHRLAVAAARAQLYPGSPALLVVSTSTATIRGFAASSRASLPGHQAQPSPSAPASEDKESKKSKSDDAVKAVVEKHVLYRGPWLLTFRLLVRCKVRAGRGGRGRGGVGLGSVGLGSLTHTNAPTSHFSNIRHVAKKVTYKKRMHRQDTLALLECSPSHSGAAVFNRSYGSTIHAARRVFIDIVEAKCKKKKRAAALLGGVSADGHRQPHRAPGRDVQQRTASGHHGGGRGGRRGGLRGVLGGAVRVESSCDP